jgi:hypothetical protein
MLLPKPSSSISTQQPGFQWMANERRRCYTASVDESRKRVILIAASIPAARKLASYDGGTRVPATICAISDAVRWAEEIMKEIDERWHGKGSSAARLLAEQYQERQALVLS